MATSEPFTNAPIGRETDTSAEYLAGIRFLALGGVVLTMAELASSVKLIVLSNPSELYNTPPMI